MWRSFMQVMVTIGAVLTVIIAIVTGISISNTADNGMLGLVSFVLIVLVGFLLLGMTGMIAEGVEYLEIIAKNGQRVSYSTPYVQTNNTNGVSSISNAKGKSILEVNRTPYHEGGSDDWYCSQCGEKNNSANAFCKYCGTHK